MGLLGRRQQQPREDAAIDRGQRLEVGDAHAFVELVDRRVHRPQLDQLGADVGDEPAVGRAADARQLGRDARDVADRRRRDVDERAARRQERASPAGPREVVVDAVAAQDGLEPLLQRLARALGRIAEVEHELQRARNHVRGAGPRVDVRALPCGGRKVRVAAIPLGCRELGQRRGQRVNRVAREIGIRDVALHALDGQRAGERAAPAVLDHVAQGAHRRRLADHAVVEALAARGQALDDLHRAVGGRTFLVGRDEQRDRAAGVRMLGQEPLDRRHERRERSLHVGRAAAVQVAVALGGHERVGRPRCERARRHDVRVAGEAHDRMRGAAPRPQVGHAVRDERVEREPQRRQPLREQRLAAGVIRRERLPRDQFARQRERGLCGGVHAADGSKWTAGP